MKLTSRVFLAIVGSIIAISANAATNTKGVPSKVLILPDSDIVTFDAGDYSGIACATNSVGKWAFKSDTSGGKAMLALLLTAQATQVPLNVQGLATGVCSVWPNRETVRFMFTD